MSAASSAASVDWALVATGAGAFIAALYATLKGLQKGKERVETGQSTITSVVGGTVMDNITMRELADALRHSAEETRENTMILRQVAAALTRQTDISLIQNRKLDFRDDRDNPVDKTT